jgi:hypothetical protein
MSDQGSPESANQRAAVEAGQVQHRASNAAAWSGTTSKPLVAGHALQGASAAGAVAAAEAWLTATQPPTAPTAAPTTASPDLTLRPGLAPAPLPSSPVHAAAAPDPRAHAAAGPASPGGAAAVHGYELGHGHEPEDQPPTPNAGSAAAALGLARASGEQVPRLWRFTFALAYGDLPLQVSHVRVIGFVMSQAAVPCRREPLPPGRGCRAASQLGVASEASAGRTRVQVRRLSQGLNDCLNQLENVGCWRG